MLTKQNDSIIKKFAWIGALLVVLDLATITVNLNIVPILEGVSIPDVFIYVKLLISLVFFAVSFLWLKKRNITLNRSHYRLIILLVFWSIIIYIFSLYLYKLVLIIQTTYSIQDHIFSGNPALYLFYSIQHYRNLRYIMIIFTNTNSEFILLIQGFIMQWVLIKSNQLVEAVEPEHEYDEFMFDIWLLPLNILTLVLVFFSAEIIQLSYNFVNISLITSIILLILLGIIMIPSTLAIFKSNNFISKTHMRGNYQRVFVISLIMFIVLLISAVIWLYKLRSGEHNYRLYTTLVALIVTGYSFIRAKMILNLENK